MYFIVFCAKVQKFQIMKQRISLIKLYYMEIFSLENNNIIRKFVSLNTIE